MNKRLGEAIAGDIRLRLRHAERLDSKFMHSFCADLKCYLDMVRQQVQRFRGRGNWNVVWIRQGVFCVSCEQMAQYSLDGKGDLFVYYA